MTEKSFNGKLYSFMHTHRMNNKGALCVALVVSRYAKKNGLPISPSKLLIILISILNSEDKDLLISVKLSIILRSLKNYLVILFHPYHILSWFDDF